MSKRPTTPASTPSKPGAASGARAKASKPA